ncbi:hypothetical protein Fcan01_16383 [Folsomia candida]|uniref:Uncharacterized protein n=1 Tax=Folsomia candida TaxID=158441 RepID=A0A226DV07_FOLCA|nr:hypothetical protein Fcan01_16383 [Folsomia candida]
MEMIIPMKYQSPWKSVMRVEDIRILMPFFLLGDRESIPRTDYQEYFSFYLELVILFNKLTKQNTEYKRFVKYTKVARTLLETLVYHFGFNENPGQQLQQQFNRTGRRAFDGYLPNATQPPPYDKSALRDFPIQPVKYDEQDSYEIVKSLSSCKKVALIDTKERIAKITDFLNDNVEKIAYMSRDDDFFTSSIGWMMIPVRESYGGKRLRVMISSGILAHWVSQYKIWKPDESLDYYSNWTHPRIEAVSKLDFSSKIVTAFYVWGICLIICFLILFGEITSYGNNA